MVEGIYVDTDFANGEQSITVPSYIVSTLATGAIVVTSILYPHGTDVEAQLLVGPDIEDGGVIEAYRAGQTRPLKEFIAELEARGEI